MPTHFQGPLLGANTAEGGLYADLPLGPIDLVRGPYKVWVEDFRHYMEDGEAADRGATVTAINTPTAATEVVDPTLGYLLVNPGTKADSGTEIQFDALPGVGAVSGYNQWNVPGSITSTTTLMDARTLIWGAQVGFLCDAAWDGKAILGVFTKDTALMAQATGLPTVAAGGGIGFHVGETGDLTYVATNAAITAAGTATGVNLVDDLTAGAITWYDLGFRCTWIDASAGTGAAYFYVNGKIVGSVATVLPFDSTEVYSVTAGIHNGPANVSDLKLDNMVTALTSVSRA